MTFSATYFGANSWLVEFEDFRILIDPWLKGNLSFPPGPWLVEGRLPNDLEVPQKLDLLVLTQGLSDHAHQPTLKELPRSLPVVGSSSAANVARKLNFERVIELKPGMIKRFEMLTIEATAGAPVPNIENGYLIRHPFGSLYLEPHGFLDNKIPNQQIDAIITPVVNISLPLVGAFVKGKTILPKLINRFNPITILASTVGGNAIFSGLITTFSKIEGTTPKDLDHLKKGQFLIDPIPGKRYTLTTHDQPYKSQTTLNPD